jgi:hypothetical protein
VFEPARQYESNRSREHGRGDEQKRRREKNRKKEAGRNEEKWRRIREGKCMSWVANCKRTRDYEK